MTIPPSAIDHQSETAPLLQPASCPSFSSLTRAASRETSNRSVSRFVSAWALIPSSLNGPLTLRSLPKASASKSTRCFGIHSAPPTGGVSDLDTVILHPEDSQHVKATYVHIWNTTHK